MSQQLSLRLEVAMAKEVDGVEMGVLKDGTPYLSSRGLARLCGVAPSAVITQVANWSKGQRDSKLARLFIERGYNHPHLYIETDRDKSDGRAHPEDVCIIFLEYYAFVATQPSPQAINAIRKLARGGFRLFIYGALGYIPTEKRTGEGWDKYHDRLLLNSAPEGYFSVFKESADFVLAAIGKGLTVDEHTVPDISIGMAWSKYWTDNHLESRFGPRKSFEHNYPDYFPQAASNPQEIHVYPIDALGEFRRWMQGQYIPSKFPMYLDGKVKRGQLPTSVAKMLAAAVRPATLSEERSSEPRKGRLLRLPTAP